MRIFSSSLLATVCVAASGCTTHLQSHRPPSAGIVHGVVYNLPEVHYDIEIKRTLTQCPEFPDKKHPVPMGQVQFQIGATATARTVPGPEIVIDYEELASVTKTTDFALERYPNGVLKSVNAKVDDRTADVAAQAFKAFVSAGKIAIGVPTSGAVSDVPVFHFIACSAEAKTILAAMPALRSDVRSAEAELKKASKALSDFETANTQVPRPADVATQAASLIRAKLSAQGTADTANEKLAAALKALTITSRFTYVPGAMSAPLNYLAYHKEVRYWTCAGRPQALPQWDPAVNGTYSDLASEVEGTTAPESILRLWTSESNETGSKQRWLIHSLGENLLPDCDDAFVSSARWSDAEGKASSADLEEAREASKSFWSSGENRLTEVLGVVKQLDAASILVTAHPLTTTSASSYLDNARTCDPGGDSRCGIVYRTKAPGRIRVCQFTRDEGLPAPEHCHGAPLVHPTVLFSEDRAIPQMGRLASLSLRNAAFSNNELSAEFGEDGTLIKMGYKKPRAEAVAMGETVNAGLDSLTALLTYAEGEELRDIEGQKRLNEARLALLNSQKGLQQPSETTMLQNEAALLKARRERIEAEIELRKKEAELEALLEAGEDASS